MPVLYLNNCRLYEYFFSQWTIHIMRPVGLTCSCHPLRTSVTPQCTSQTSGSSGHGQATGVDLKENRTKSMTECI